MPATVDLIAYSLVALGMVLTPGPNMIYLVSRTISQGRRAALLSLAGIAAGFLFYMLCAALGITALLMAIPYAYDALRLAGAAYLLYLAWQTIRPGGRGVFDIRELAPDSRKRLFATGLLTSLLNPKIAVLYLSLMPQFVDPGRGSVFAQSLFLGCAQIAISLTVNSLIILGAGGVATLLASRPLWARAQRWLTASLLGGLAVRMALDGRR